MDSKRACRCRSEDGSSAEHHLRTITPNPSFLYSGVTEYTKYLHAGGAAAVSCVLLLCALPMHQHPVCGPKKKESPLQIFVNSFCL